MFAIIFYFLLLIPSVSLGSTLSLQDQINSLKTENAALLEKLTSAAKMFKQFDSENTRLKEQNVKLNEKIIELEEELKESQAEIEEIKRFHNSELQKKELETKALLKKCTDERIVEVAELKEELRTLQETLNQVKKENLEQATLILDLQKKLHEAENNPLIPQMEKTIEECGIEMKEATTRYSSLEEQYKILEEENKTYMQCSTDLELCKREKNSLEKKIEEANTTYQQLEQESSDAQAALEKRIKNLEKKVEDLEESLADKGTSEMSEVALQQKELQVEELTQKVNSLEKELIELEKENSSLKTSFTPTSDTNAALIEQLTTDNKNLKENIEDLKKEVRALQTKKPDCSAIENDYAALQQQAQEQGNLLKEEKETTRTLEQKIKKLEQTIKDLTDQLNMLKTIPKPLPPTPVPTPTPSTPTPTIPPASPKPSIQLDTENSEIFKAIAQYNNNLEEENKRLKETIDLQNKQHEETFNDQVSRRVEERTAELEKRVRNANERALSLRRRSTSDEPETSTRRPRPSNIFRSRTMEDL